MNQLKVIGSSTRKQNKTRIKTLWSLAAIAAVLASAEALCRTALGLGDPPLSKPDAEMEYLWRPTQTCHRFHNLIHINAYSMRSEDFARRKTDSNELRAVVIGDSVVFGGTQIDQRDICTEVLKRVLEKDLHRKVTVGNIAAKSWGPPNELAYLKRFGLFDADVAIIVLNSSDYADVPTYHKVVDVDPDYPGHKPISALGEAITRYLPRYLPKSLRPYTNPDENQNPTARDIAWALKDEKEMIKLARRAGAKVIVAQMMERDEINGHSKIGHAFMLEAAQSENAQVLQIGELFERAVNEGQNPYLDNIHPNVLGCKIMGEGMARKIEAELSRGTPSTQTPNP